MEKKSLVVFAVLGLLLGSLGVQRAYIGEWEWLVLGIIGVLTSVVGIGSLICMSLGVFGVIDAIRALADKDYAEKLNLTI